MNEFLVAIIPALGQALLSFLWQGTFIGLLAAIVLEVLRRARPQARYLVACLALLCCVLVPTVTLIAQFAAISHESHLGGASAQAPSIGDGVDAPGALFGFALSAGQIDALLPWVVALWAAGSGAMSLRMALGLSWVRYLRNTPQRAEQAAWQTRLDALARHFNLRIGIALRLVDNVDSPLSVGWWRPVVLLPTALLARMPADLIEALLAHELAHIRRHDYLVNLVQNAVEALLFYHPVTWWLSRRIRVEREQIADQIATDVACTPRRLAVALSELSEIRRTRPAFHLAQAAHGGQLMSRIERLVRPARRARFGARIVFPLLGLTAACIATYSYAQIGETQSQQAEALSGQMTVRNTDLMVLGEHTEILHVQQEPTPGTRAELRKAERLAAQQTAVARQRLEQLAKLQSKHAIAQRRHIERQMQALSARQKARAREHELRKDALQKVEAERMQAQQQHYVALLHSTM